MVGHFSWSTPASEHSCLGEMPKEYVRCHTRPRHFQRYDNYGKSTHLNINADNNIYFDVFKDIHVPGDTSINAVSLEQYNAEYVRPNADLETRPPVRSRESQKHMYPQCLNNIGEFKILKVILSRAYIQAKDANYSYRN